MEVQASRASWPSTIETVPLFIRTPPEIVTYSNQFVLLKMKLITAAMPRLCSRGGQGRRAVPSNITGEQ